MNREELTRWYQTRLARSRFEHLLDFLDTDRTEQRTGTRLSIRTDLLRPAGKARAEIVANMTEPIKRRRWFRFGLRTLLLAMTVLCVWLGFNVNAARRQKEAVDAILKAGGTVTFSYQCVPVRGNPDTLSLDPNALLTTPAWLRACLGDDFFRNTVEVILSGRAIFERTSRATDEFAGDLVPILDRR